MNDATLATLLPGFHGPTLPPWLADRLRAGLGGVCLFATNIESLDQLRDLTDQIYAANPDAVIAVDEEGGDVTRLFARTGAPYPGNAVLGRLDDIETTRAVAAQVGAELRRAGVNVDFAPSVDVNSNPQNPVIGVRSFGADPARVAAHGAAWVEGLQAQGVAATAKHFPGHGDTGLDSHLALPVVDRSLAELGERELVPFVAAIAAGTRLVMTSHILLPQLDADNPATLSRAVLTGLLRERLGFGGVIVTDALDMAGAASPGGPGETAVRALRAGCDLLCLGTDNTDADLTAITDAVAASDLSAGRLAESADRVRSLRPELVDGPDISSGLTPDDVIAAFDLSPAARSWRGRAGAYEVVRFDTRPNSAVGYVPWGPFAAGLSADFVVTGSGSHLPGPNRPILVVGQDIHRHAFARQVVDRLRAERRDVLVVDMGWPSDDRRYADAATFGASRLIGRALLAFLSNP